MNQVLKWLNNHDMFVHMVVMFTVFYGLPLSWVLLFQPSMVASIVASAGIGLVLILVIYFAYWFATMVTRIINDAVARAALDEIRDTSLDTKIERPRMIDLDSSTTLVVENMKQETRDAVDNLKQTVESMTSDATLIQETLSVSHPAESPQDKTSEKKKRGPRRKTAKKEG